MSDRSTSEKPSIGVWNVRFNGHVRFETMVIDLHSHFFPIEALKNPGRYQHRAPKIAVDQGKLSVTSQIGVRAGLGAGAYDPVARIKALDEMSIDVQAISPSPILLFYWEEPEVAAHFSILSRRSISYCSCILSKAVSTPTIRSAACSATFSSLPFAPS